MFAQTSATAPAAATVTVQVPSGTSVIALPVVHAPVFQAQISQFVADGSSWTLKFNAPGFTPGAFKSESAGFATHYAEVVSEHPLQGAGFSITGQTADSVTVAGIDGESLAFNATLAIRPHRTLGEVFAGAEADLSIGDHVRIFRDGASPFVRYDWNGSFWTGDGSSNHNARPIEPGRGIVVTLAAPATLKWTGWIKQTPTRIRVFAGAVNLIGTGSPISRNLVDLQLASQLDPYVDQVKLLSADGTLTSLATVINTGTLLTGDFQTDAGPTVVPFQSAYVVIPDRNVFWLLPPPQPADSP